MLHSLGRHIAILIDPIKFHLILALIHLLLRMNLRFHNQKLISNLPLPPLLLLLDLLGFLVIYLQLLPNILKHLLQLLPMLRLGLLTYLFLFSQKMQTFISKITVLLFVLECRLDYISAFAIARRRDLLRLLS